MFVQLSSAFVQLSSAARWLRGLWEKFQSAGPSATEARGLELLKEWLSPEQLAPYNANGLFDVTGCDSGKRYRFQHGAAMNVGESHVVADACTGWYCIL